MLGSPLELVCCAGACTCHGKIGCTAGLRRMSDDDEDEDEEGSEEEADMSDGEAKQAQRLAGQVAKAGAAPPQQVHSPCLFQ